MADDAIQQANRSGMDPKRLVAMFLIVAGLVLALFLGNVLAPIWAQLGWRDPAVIEGVGWHLTGLLGVLLAGVAVLASVLLPGPRQHLMEVSSELMKVTWPSLAETRVSTMAVIVASVVASLILFGMDTVAYQVMVEWLPVLWGRL